MELNFSELMQAPLSNIYAIRELQLILEGLSISENDILLEIGVGNGLGSLVLSKYTKRTIGIDISESLIKFLNESQKPENVEFHVMDAIKEPPRKFLEKFDLCICVDVMEHVESPEKLLSFITKILRRGGCLSMTFPINNIHHGQNYFTVKDVYGLFSRAGGLKSDIKIVRLNRGGLLIDEFYNKVQKVIRPTKDVDIFEESVCFEMIINPKKIHYLMQVGIILLFRISRNAYYEDKSGNRALIYAVKV